MNETKYPESDRLEEMFDTAMDYLERSRLLMESILQVGTEKIRKIHIRSDYKNIRQEARNFMRFQLGLLRKRKTK